SIRNNSRYWPAIAGIQAGTISNMQQAMERGRLALMALVFALHSAAAVAELKIEITEGVDKAGPIAGVPFGWQGSGGEAPLAAAAIVAADLAHSGRFAPLERQDMLQKPTSAADVDFADWRTQSVEALVIGRVVQLSPGQYEIQFQLFDVLRGESLLTYRQ